MTFFDGSEAEQSPTTETVSRPLWVKCMGVGSGIAVLGFVLLAIGVFTSVPTLTALGIGGLCLAGVAAASGGYVYFFFERGE